MARNSRDLNVNVRGNAADLERAMQEAEKAVRDVQRELDRVDNTRVSASVDANTAKAQAQIKAVERQASALDGRNINLDFDTRRVADTIALMGALTAAVSAVSAAAPAAAAAIAAVPAAAGAAATGVGALIAGFQGVGDAVEALGEAEKALQRGGEDAVKAQHELQEVMQGLTPEARSLAISINREVMPALRGIRDGVQATMLPRMQSAMERMTTLAPGLTAGLAGTGVVLGDLADEGSRMMTSGPWREDFATIIAGNNLAIEQFGQSGLELADSFRILAAESVPLVDRFAGFTQRASEAFNQFLEGKRSTGELTMFLADMGDELAQLWTTFTQTASGVWDLMQALAPIGDAILSVIGPLAQMVGNFAEAHPLLVQLVAASYIASSAFIGFGRTMNGLRGTFALATEGWQKFGSGMRTAFWTVPRAGITSLGNSMAGLRLMMVNTGASAQAMSGHFLPAATGARGLGAAAAAAGGPGGLGALRGAAGGLVGFLCGPWGLAIAGAGIALSILASRQAEARQKTQEHEAAVAQLSETLDEQTGAITEQTRLHVSQQAAQDGMIQRARDLGIAAEDVTDAITGQGTAYEDLTGRLRGNIRAAVENSNAWRNNRDAFVNAGLTLDDLTNAALGVPGAMDHLNERMGAAGGSASAAGVSIRGLREELPELSGASGELARYLIEQAQRTREAQQAVRDAAAAMGTSTAAAATYRSAVQTLGDEFATTEDRARALNDAINSVFGENLTRDEAIGRMHEALRGLDQELTELVAQGVPLTAMFDAATGRFNVTTEAGFALHQRTMELQEGLHGAALASWTAAGGQQNLAASIGAAAEQAYRGYDAFIQEMTAIGLTRDQAHHLAVQFGLLPEQVITEVIAANAPHVIDQMADIHRRLSNLPPNTPVQVDALTAEAMALLEALGFRVVTLPDGRVEVIADPGTLAATERAINHVTRPRHVSVSVENPANWGMHTSLFANQRYGGIQVPGYQRGGLRPMRSDVADVIPPNTWRIIGDRMTGDEAFIPINRDQRSMAILQETARRMGFQLLPMARGGVVGFAAGGTATTRSGESGAAGIALDAEGAAETSDAVNALNEAIQTLTAAGLEPLAEQLETTTDPALSQVATRAGVDTTEAIRLLQSSLPPLTAETVNSGNVQRATWDANTATVQASQASQSANYALLNANLAGATAGMVGSVTGMQLSHNASWANITAVSGASIGTITGPQFATMHAGLGGLQTGFIATDASLAGSWGRIVTTSGASIGTITGPQFGTMHAGLAALQTGFADTATGIGIEFNRIRAATADPIRFAIEGPINRGMGDAWNALDRFFALNKPWAPVPVNFAVGGAVHGPGSGTSDSIPARLSHGEHVWTAAEVRAVGGHERMQLLRDLAAKGKLSPLYAAGGPVPGFALGGPVDTAMWNVISGAFPGISLTSAFRPGDPGHHGEARAIDVGYSDWSRHAMVAAWIAQHYPNSLELISAQFRGGVGIDNGSPFHFGEPTTSQHRDHVHWAMASLAALGNPAIGLGSGAALFDLAGYLGEQFADARNMAGEIRERFGDGNIPIALEAMVNQAIDGAIAHAEQLMATMIGPGPGSGVEQWRGVALRALAIAGQPASMIDLLLMQMASESGGNPRAVNDWDVNAANGQPSTGLMQVIRDTYAAHKHPQFDFGPYLNGVSINPLSNILAAIRYTLSRYGSLAAGWRGVGYEDGGVAARDGLGYLHSGERVLDREQTRAFDRLVEVITTRRGLGLPGVHGGDGGALIGNLTVQTTPMASARQIIGEATHAVRVARAGGVHRR